MKIAALNADKEHVSDEQFSRMVQACQLSLNDFDDAWDFEPSVIVGIETLSDAEDDEFILTIVHRPDVAGAGGYHDVDKRGRPFLRVFTEPYLTNGGVVIALRAEDFNASVLGAMTHECLETKMDRDCRGYELVGPGRWLTAREPCDACEDVGYPVTLPDGGAQVWVTDFLLPGWFTGRAPFSKTGSLRRPWPAMTPGGYRIDVRASGSPVSRQSTRGGHGQARTARVAEPLVTFGDSMPTWKRSLKMTHGRIGKRVREMG